MSPTEKPGCPTCTHRYWSPIDEAVREAAVLRGVQVRLLISFWEETHPLTINFVSSLQTLCMQLLNCSIEAVRSHPLVTLQSFPFYDMIFASSFVCLVSQRFFSHRTRGDDNKHGLNHNKYMVTDNSVYIGEIANFLVFFRF